MFEDLARNLAIPHQLGMTTVLVVPDGSTQVVREDWELEGRKACHVDHVTDDLTGFLEGLSKGETALAPQSQPSCHAKAGHPVRRGLRRLAQPLQSTGSPALAGDDSEPGLTLLSRIPTKPPACQHISQGISQGNLRCLCPPSNPPSMPPSTPARPSRP